MDWESPQEIPADAVDGEPRLITDAERKLLRAALGFVAAKNANYQLGYGVPRYKRPALDRSVEELVQATLPVRSELIADWESRHTQAVPPESDVL